MTPGSFQPRRLGEHLLVAQLGEDCLGTIYRALHATDEHRFVRLRVLQSPELSPLAVFSAIARNGETVARLTDKAIVQHAELSIADGTPFCAWYENAGWTLDTVLAKLRASATPLPIAFGLLIAERVCAALEHAWFSPVDGEPIRHGLLWTGFVSISNDAEIRLGGFGLADAVLPSISRGRLARDIAPYIAAEARESGRIGPTSDSYSAGVLLLELLTCRRPKALPSDSGLRSDDAFPAGIRDLLDRCFAAPPDRFSILELHRALQEQLAAGPAPISPADLALFLYTLLNPESRAVAPTDGDSTNPIAADRMDGERQPSRRRSDTPPAGLAGAETDVARVMEEDAPFLVPARDEPRLDPEGDASLAALEPRSLPAAAPPRRWLPGVAYFAVAAAIIVGVEGLAIHRDRGGAPLPTRPDAATEPSRAYGQPVPAKSEAGVAPAVEPPSAASVVPRGIVTAKSNGRLQRPPGDSRAPVRPADVFERAGRSKDGRDPGAQSARREAQDARFQAAWARIEAERGEAGDLAADAFARGRSAEADGDRFLRGGQYAPAREAFERAAASFREAGTASRQARLERIKLSPPTW